MGTKQYGTIRGKASLIKTITGEVKVGTKNIRELRFMPFSSFPTVGQEDILYIDTDLNDIYFWDGTTYQKCTPSDVQSIIDDDIIGTNKTWSSSKIKSEFDDDQSQIDALVYEPINNADIDLIINS